MGVTLRVAEGADLWQTPYPIPSTQSGLSFNVKCKSHIIWTDVSSFRLLSDKRIDANSSRTECYKL